MAREQRSSSSTITGCNGGSDDRLVDSEPWSCPSALLLSSSACSYLPSWPITGATLRGRLMPSRRPARTSPRACPSPSRQLAQPLRVDHTDAGCPPSAGRVVWRRRVHRETRGRRRTQSRSAARAHLDRRRRSRPSGLRPRPRRSPPPSPVAEPRIVLTIGPSARWHQALPWERGPGLGRCLRGAWGGRWRFSS